MVAEFNVLPNERGLDAPDELAAELVIQVTMLLFLSLSVLASSCRNRESIRFPCRDKGESQAGEPESLLMRDDKFRLALLHIGLHSGTKTYGRLVAVVR